MPLVAAMTEPADDRPAPWYDPPPAGFHFEAVAEGDDWELDSTRTCRRSAVGGRFPRPGCGRQSVAVLWRKYGANGRRRWAYCEDHMYGRWIEDGKIMHWILKADEDG